jgi:2-isopropylmalate synthase
MPLNPQAAYVGSKAFAHKAGVHTSAISRRSDAYEHIEPERVGNKTRFAVSEMAGRTAIDIKAHELGLQLDDIEISEIVDSLKKLEYDGYHFEVADASLELLMRQAAGWKQDFFKVINYEIVVDESEAKVGAFKSSETLTTKAKIEIEINGTQYCEFSFGNGPVNALDNALRQAVESQYPGLRDVHLLDYKVRILDSDRATGAITRVLIDSSNGHESWTTIGVSENIIEASWQALCDSLVIGLLRLGSGH